MNNVDEVIQVIFIGLIVSGFLLNTRRFLKSIELCKECLFILKDRAGIRDEKLSKLFYKRIYLIMWKACRLISDNTNAIKYAEKIVQIYRESGERHEECMLSIELAEVYCHQSKYARAKELSEEALLISKEIGDRNGEACCYGNLGTVYRSLGEYEKAREHLERSLAMQEKNGNRNREAFCLASLGTVYRSFGEYKKAREHLEKSLAIQKETGDRNGEATSYVNLGAMYRSVGDYKRAREYLEKSLAIQKETGDRHGEATSYVNLENVYRSVGKYEKAREHLEKSLAIQREIRDRKGEATTYLNFGTMYQSLGEYERAKERLEKSLTISREIGDRHTQALSYLDLGATYCSLGKYGKAAEHNKRALSILSKIGVKEGEAKFYISQGTLLSSIPGGNLIKSKEHFEKALAISKEIGNREIEAASILGLANLPNDYAEDIREEDYKKAMEHIGKALEINEEIGDRIGETTCHSKVGAAYQSVSEYEKARENLEISVIFQEEVGHKKGAAISYLKLATVYESVGEREKASRYFEKSLATSKTIGDRRAIASCYLELGARMCSTGKYSKANEYNKKAIAIFNDLGCREEMAKGYINQGDVEIAVGNTIKAKEYFEFALAISKELRNGELEAAVCLRIGRFFLNRAEYDRAEHYIKKARDFYEAVGDISGHFSSLEMMAQLRIVEGKIQEAIWCFHSAIIKCEKICNSLYRNDTFKISLLDRNIRCYRELSKLLLETGNPIKALHASELSGARALADLMSANYSVKNQISSNPLTWTSLEGIVPPGCSQTFLHVSYFSDRIYLWILKASQLAYYQRIQGCDLISLEGVSQHLKEFFNFRSFGVLAEEICEDRSSYGSQPESKSGEEDSHEVLRLGNVTKSSQGPKMNLPICYKLIIAPVMNFLEGPEIIIVPDRALYQIPFAALTNESGRYLSETFRIRIVPSLTTLKLIKESPADYHCQTGALIVGNPDVGEVYFKGRLTNILRLPSAENEAKMIAKKLGVEPLLRQQATKEAVLQVMNSVALIHIAAHGDAERGEIALTPSFRIPNGIPQEEEYLLTTRDISKVQVRAKLVVLSCCHGPRGLTKAEGAVGIARAFLGSGARSVLVSLWALHDKGTEQLMTHFYDHLVGGKSACESLHEAMKWMRSEGYDVNQWAPFILIGDDVTFDFEKIGGDKNDQDDSE